MRLIDVQMIPRHGENVHRPVHAVLLVRQGEAVYRRSHRSHDLWYHFRSPFGQLNAYGKTLHDQDNSRALEGDLIDISPFVRIELLLPVMTWGWLITSLFIWWMVPPLNWLEALVCAASTQRLRQNIARPGQFSSTRG
jgi:hypothetical protein